MKYQVLFEKGRYALIRRGVKFEEYAVVFGLNKERGDWEHTCSYANFSPVFGVSEAEALCAMLDVFRSKTEEGYVERERLVELLEKFKDGLVADDKASAYEYFKRECKLSAREAMILGIEKEMEVV